MELFRGMSPFPVSLERYFVDVNRKLKEASWGYMGFRIWRVELGALGFSCVCWFL